MIDASNLDVDIGASEVLHGVSVRVAAGELVAVVGANGAGKTTLLRALSGLLPAKSGMVRLMGESVDHWPAYRRAKAGLVHVPQGRQVIPHLSVRENLLIGAQQISDLTASERQRMLDAEFARFPVLGERSNLMAGALSGGEQQMLAVSRGLMMQPKVLMLDEPSLGLASANVIRARRLRSQRRQFSSLSSWLQTRAVQPHDLDGRRLPSGRAE